MSEAENGRERNAWHYQVFQTLCISAFDRVRSLQDAGLAAGQLVLARMRLEEVPTNASASDHPVIQELSLVNSEGALGLREEWHRTSLIASITMFDSFLSDLMRLLFLHQPKALPKEKQCSFGEILAADSYEQLLEHVVSRMVHELAYKSYPERLKYLEKRFHIKSSDAEDRLPSLVKFAELRNKVVHDTASYSYGVATGGRELKTERKSVPRVDFYTSMNSAMVVAEVIDALFVAATRKVFKREPAIRLMTPSVIAAHEKFRAGVEREG